MALRPMFNLFGKVVAFGVWAFLGAASTYAALYVLTPYGVALFVGIALIALALVLIGQNHVPELWGLLAGPGIFCLVVAINVQFLAAEWLVVGVAFIAAALLAFVISGRARCVGGT